MKTLKGYHTDVLLELDGDSVVKIDGTFVGTGHISLRNDLIKDIEPGTFSLIEDFLNDYRLHWPSSMGELKQLIKESWGKRWLTNSFCYRIDDNKLTIGEGLPPTRDFNYWFIPNPMITVIQKNL